MRFQQSAQQRQSDQNAVQMIADKGFTQDEAHKVWNARWNAGSDLQEEFPSAEIYAAYMDAQLAKMKMEQSMSLSQDKGRTPNFDFLSGDENAAMKSVRDRNLTKSETTEFWHARWQRSS